MKATPPFSILLVEDSPDDVFFFRRVLSKCDVPTELTVADDGRKALKLLEEENKAKPFGIIFLDLKLPMVSGFEVLKWIRNSDVKRPVYVLSGSHEIEDQKLASTLGTTDYLVKPLASDVLPRILKSVLG